MKPGKGGKPDLLQEAGTMQNPVMYYNRLGRRYRFGILRKIIGQIKLIEVVNFSSK